MSTGNRVGLYVGMMLALPASVALEGAGLWLALGPRFQIAAGAIAALAAGALTCLIGTVVIGVAVLRERARRSEDVRPAAVVPRPRTEEEAAAMVHSQKMEALGLLAGEVAHDFNNLLHVIRNALEILQRQDPQADPRRCLEMIRHSADRAAALTQQLLAFARRRPLEVRPVDANELVARMAELLRHSLGGRITVETVLGRGIGDVAADAGQLETALLNLAINARDAMSHAGQLTIETASSMLDEQYVMISVSDTGTGMLPEVAARACEPFFTTKEPGHGTGLGLSQVAGFAQQAGGQVRIASQPGKGTTVRLYLPRMGRLAERPPFRQQMGYAWSIKDATKSVPLAIGAGRER
ncbi:MAG TPA: ATP-binding protein [Steroidobacteraceae bacterium]|nr:ATP-binding protein [Steroidobacteraceae bacterium]